jgi:hypothetical protein
MMVSEKFLLKNTGLGGNWNGKIKGVEETGIYV